LLLVVGIDQPKVMPLLREPLRVLPASGAEVLIGEPLNVHCGLA
jgi:hypothetical protein